MYAARLTCCFKASSVGGIFQLVFLLRIIVGVTHSLVRSYQITTNLCTTSMIAVEISNGVFDRIAKASVTCGKCIPGIPSCLLTSTRKERNHITSCDGMEHQKCFRLACSHFSSDFMGRNKTVILTYTKCYPYLLSQNVLYVGNEYDNNISVHCSDHNFEPMFKILKP